MSYIEALHGEHPVIIGGVIKPALDHSVVRELLQHPDRLALPPGLVERCRGTRPRPVRGSWWGGSAGLAGCGGGAGAAEVGHSSEQLQPHAAGMRLSGPRL